MISKVSGAGSLRERGRRFIELATKLLFLGVSLARQLNREWTLILVVFGVHARELAVSKCR